MITFYEKPGCLTNRKQKAMLQSAGFALKVESLLEHPWQEDELLAFFNGMEVADWFNPSAPAVKNGDVDPGGLDAEVALALLVANPLLIKRPLLEKDNQRMAGFDSARMKHSLGIDLSLDDAGDTASIEQCSRTGTDRGCP